MEHRALGRSEIQVSRIILGCGNFGGIGSDPAHHGGGTSREDALRLLDAAWELGVTTLDTADAYGGGRSEEFVGAWLASRPADVREQVVVATKTFNPMAAGADRGLSRARIRRQLDSSRRRLGLDRIPLYLAHDFDPGVPQEETLEAFDELVREGAVGAVGASNFTADQVAEALELSALEGLTRYDWVQNGFSLLVQDDRETMFPLCHEHDLGYTPFGPLAGGWLTGKYRRDTPPPPGSRMTLRPEGSDRFRNDATFSRLEELERLAGEIGHSMAGLAVAWLLTVPEVTAIVVGPNTVEQLGPVREALELRLGSDERAAIGRLFP